VKLKLILSPSLPIPIQRNGKAKSMNEQKIKIGITIGDINGIGPEIIIKTLQKNALNRYFNLVIYGSTNCLNYYKQVLKIVDFNYIQLNAVKNADLRHINVINCWNNELQITIGKPSEAGAKAALAALERASIDLLNGQIDALVTAPVNKGNLAGLQPEFVGQTEFLTKAANTKESLMILASDELKVGLVTNHLPVSEISKNFTKKKLNRKIELFIDSLERDFLINKPRIAVLALNPHAGDEGKIGMEEKTIINPVIEAQSQEHLIYGPYPADGFFGNQKVHHFDGILAMYHDQGLAPFKALSFGEGVNITAGLPFVRTSPDHGTAYDIAGQNIASVDSFRKALFLAYDIVKNRQQYSEMTKNPLKFATKKKANNES